MGYPKHVMQTAEYLWDFDVTNTAAESHADTGVVAIFSAPANCLVHSVKALVETLVAGATAEEVGDGTDVDGFVVDGFAAATGLFPLYVTDAASTFAGAFTLDQNAGVTDALDVNTVSKDKLYASADTIDYKISGTATAGKIRFFVCFTRL